MATVWKLLPTPEEFYAELQERSDLAELRRLERHKAVLLIQRYTRGYLIRKWVAWLSHNATIIQNAFRVHQAKKEMLAALRRAVRSKHAKFYALAATKIQVHSF